MLSMTGFGKAEYKNGYEIRVEIKTVNNRFLDIQPKYPRSFIAYDDKIRKTVQSKITRGRVEIFFTFSDLREREKNVSVDLPLAKAYYEAAKELAKYIGAENDLSVTQLMRVPDIIDYSNDDDDDLELENAIETALLSALDNLNVMRKTEGDKLKKDLLSHVDEVERLVSKIEQRAPLVAENFRKRIEERVKNILDGVSYDEARLLQEVAVFADKSCIDEELTRLKSHISQYRKLLETETPGRKVDFLVQEFNREANTICSKSNDIEVTNDALLLKGEIEKIREQIQNIE